LIFYNAALRKVKIAKKTPASARAQLPAVNPDSKLWFIAVAIATT
jgi:hypothetical protein